MYTNCKVCCSEALRQTYSSTSKALFLYETICPQSFSWYTTRRQRKALLHMRHSFIKFQKVHEKSSFTVPTSELSRVGREQSGSIATRNLSVIRFLLLKYFVNFGDIFQLSSPPCEELIQASAVERKKIQKTLLNRKVLHSRSTLLTMFKKWPMK